MDIEISGVDHEIGLALQLLEEVAFEADAVADAPGVGERVAAP